MQLINPQKVTRRQIFIRRAIWVLIIAVIFGAWRAYPVVVRHYKAWKQERALTRAKDFLDKKDPAAAKLEIEIALTAVPGSSEAIRVAADLLDQIGSSQGLVLRRRVVEANPDSLPDRLALAALALRLRDFNTAREALSAIPATEQERPEVIRANLGYALALDARPIADALFSKLAKLGVATDDEKILHTMLLRQHPNPEKSAAARREFAALAANPKYSLQVNRILYTEAVAAKDFATAARTAALITADPAATFADQLNQATLQLLVEKKPFEAVFAQLAPPAAASGPHAAEFARWLIVQGKAADADRWLDTLPATLAGSAAIANARLDIAVATKDWDRFAHLLQAGALGPVPKEIVQLAMAAQLFDTRNSTLRGSAWAEALAAAGNSLPAQRILLRIAEAWQWENETEQVLLAITRTDPTQIWAHTALMNVYRQRRDGAKMLSVLTYLRNSTSRSLTYVHDWALLTMLVSPDDNWSAAKTAARDAYLADPANPSYATTYALALAQVGKPDEALAVIEKLPPDALNYPLRAPYLAYIYGTLRRRADYEKYAALTPRNVVLKEENALLALGERALERPLPKPATPPRKPKEPVAKSDLQPATAGAETK